MARKNLLQGLMNPDSNNGPSTLATPAHNRPLKGAIGAVSQSIEALKARSLLDIEPALIDAGGLVDRLDGDDTEDAALMASIQAYGQQVPVMVRPHPTEPGRYQIVYGRRRVLAMRTLGKPVKALVRALDDSALVMAQGQENSARKNLSFIEKANFAAQMREAEYDRKAMCDALSIDKTVISRMLLVVDRLGDTLIQAIGSAPAVGRDRWAQLADQLEHPNATAQTLIDALAKLPAGTSSNQRFDAALRHSEALTKPVKSSTLGAKDASSKHDITQSSGTAVIASVVSKKDKVVLTLPRTDTADFADWLIQNLPDVHAQWFANATADQDTESNGG